MKKEVVINWIILIITVLGLIVFLFEQIRINISSTYAIYLTQGEILKSDTNLIWQASFENSLIMLGYYLGTILVAYILNKTNNKWYLLLYTIFVITLLYIICPEVFFFTEYNIIDNLAFNLPLLIPVILAITYTINLFFKKKLG